MKKTLILLSCILCLTLVGCGPADASAPAASASDTLPAAITSAASAVPSVSAAALNGPYTIDTATIYNALHKAVYNAEDYYAEDQSVWVSKLSEGDGALYFIECAGLANGAACGCDAPLDGSSCALVRIDGDGGSREALLTTGSDGLFDIQPFAGQVFYATGTDTGVSVGYVPENGGEPVLLSLPSEDGSAICYDAAFALDGDSLVITARYYTEASQADTTQVWRVGKDLSVTAEA